jgi:hypothetical protein
MRKTIALLIPVICIGLASGLLSASAQDESKKEVPAQSGKFEPVQPYRLDFAFNEVSDGKVLNTRRYSMNLTASESNEIKIGTRVPVAAASSTNTSAQVQYQYLDVGTSIWAQLREHGEELLLVVRSDVSNLDTSNESEHTSVSLPIVRQIKISGSTLLVVGKPILIGGMDDPNSKRQFQLEVTVTKLK